MNKKRLFLIIFIPTLLFIAIIIAAILNFISPKSYISLSVAPENVVITVDNKQKINAKNGDTITVSPGSHAILISQDNFDSYTAKISLSQNETKNILAALNPKNDSARQLLNNSNSNKIVQESYNQTSKQQKEILSKNYPLINKLPVYTRSYVISACESQKYPGDSTKIAICITTTTDEAKPYALKKIQSLGFNPTDYEIIWKNDAVRYE